MRMPRMGIWRTQTRGLTACAAAAAAGGIPHWPMHTVLSPLQLNEMLSGLDQRASKADDAVYARLLRACGNAKALEQGKRVHAHVIAHADHTGLFFGNRLVNMYRKCGNLDEARAVFDGMRERDVVSWTAMIAAYAQNGHQKEALELFRRMQVIPNRVTFISVLNACDSPEVSAEGVLIHALVAESGLESDVGIANALINMYAKCERLEDAMRVFTRMQERDVVSWNTAIAANTQAGHAREALQLFKRMQLEGTLPEKVTFVTALNACTSFSAMADAKLIHKLVLQSGLEADVVVGTALVTVYGRCGSLEDACRLFYRMPQRNVVSWNAMIAAYAQHGHFKKALELYEQMQQPEGVAPSRVTFVTILNAISTPEALAEGKRIHASIVAGGFESQVLVGNALVTMYGKCGSLDEARRVFDRMCQRDVVSWNAMISAYALFGHCRKAILLFQQMRVERVAPNSISFLTALNACATVGDLAEGELVHAYSMECGFGSNISVANATVHMYANCGSLEAARRMFDGMQRRDVISWNAIITAYVQHGKPRDAFLMLRRMQLDGTASNQVTFMTILSICDSPAAFSQGKLIHACISEEEFAADPIVAAAVMNMYGKCGRVDEARVLFDEIGQKNLVSFNAMIGAYAQHGYAKQAFELFERMQVERVMPDMITFVTILNACTAAAAVAEGKLIHSRAVESGFEADGIMGNSLVSMYAKCGSLDTAYRIFERMKQRDVVSWNGMIAGYAHSGHASKALKFFWLMQQEGVEADSITFLSTISACSHAGMVAQGGDYFVSMFTDHKLRRTPEHFGCMVDLLSRAGRVADAEYFVRTMPLQANGVSWMTLLGACRVHGDMERAKRVARTVLELDPGNSAAYVVLSNTYASAGRSKQEPAQLDRLDEFLVQDQTHPQTDEIDERCNRKGSEYEAAAAS